MVWRNLVAFVTGSQMLEGCGKTGSSGVNLIATGFVEI